MSNNDNTGCFSLFKKVQSRESNEDNRHIRRSRSSIGSDALSYLRPVRNQPDRQKDLEHEPIKKDTQNNDIPKTRSRERSCRKPKDQTLDQYRKERISVFDEGNMPENETERGSRRGTGIGPEIEPITETELKTKTESKPRKRTGKTKPKTPTPPRTTEGPESDDDFKRNIEILEQQIESLDLRSKMMATMWLSRLRAPTENKEEIIARNLITSHLIKCRNENIFQKVPFNIPPTSDTLANIKQKMLLTRDTLCHDMTLANRMETKAYLNKLFHDSYDGGKFLGKLPVPRDGAFFILHLRPNL